MDKTTDGVHLRRKVVQGWGFRTDLSHEAENGIKEYIKTGDPDHLPYTYRRLRDKLRSDPESTRLI